MVTAKLTISRLATLSGIGVETVRYYQRIGLIVEPPKPEHGYRIYPEEIIRKLKFIQRAKQLGFTLAEIRELLKLDGADCEQTREIASHKLVSIRQKIIDLTTMGTALEDLLSSCESNTLSNCCPIIDILSKD